MSYGFEFRDADGIERLKITESLPRVIHSVRLESNYSGSFTVPEFSVNDGMFYFAPVAVKLRSASGGLALSTTDLDSPALYSTPPYYAYYLVPKVSAFPTVTWDEPTKTATVTPSSLPSDWPQDLKWVGPTSWNPAYWLVFLRTNTRFTVT